MSTTNLIFKLFITSTSFKCRSTNSIQSSLLNAPDWRVFLPSSSMSTPTHPSNLWNYNQARLTISHVCSWYTTLCFVFASSGRIGLFVCKAWELHLWNQRVDEKELPKTEWGKDRVYCSRIWEAEADKLLYLTSRWEMYGFHLLIKFAVLDSFLMPIWQWSLKFPTVWGHPCTTWGT